MRKISKVIRGNKTIRLTKSAVAYAIATLMVKNGEIEEEDFEPEYVKMMLNLDMKELTQKYEYQLMLRISNTGNPV